eukprot:1158126-Pelagomonas_calceolata.AAC.4
METTKLAQLAACVYEGINKYSPNVLGPIGIFPSAHQGQQFTHRCICDKRFLEFLGAPAFV